MASARSAFRACFNEIGLKFPQHRETLIRSVQRLTWIYLYTFVYICVYIYVYAYIHTYDITRMYLCKMDWCGLCHVSYGYTCICMSTHISCVYIYTYVYIYMYICTFVLYIHMYICTFVYIYTYILYIYIRICMTHVTSVYATRAYNGIRSNFAQLSSICSCANIWILVPAMLKFWLLWCWTIIGSEQFCYFLDLIIISEKIPGTKIHHNPTRRHSRKSGPNAGTHAPKCPKSLKANLSILVSRTMFFIFWCSQRHDICHVFVPFAYGSNVEKMFVLGKFRADYVLRSLSNVSHKYIFVCTHEVMWSSSRLTMYIYIYKHLYIYFYIWLYI